ncbi:MAG: polysaccharide biosynthesis tyrosine autokinase [Bacteroidota bacterium]
MSSHPSEYTPTGNDQGKFSPADILFKYLAYLPLFVICLVISVGVGIMYLRYTTPKYISAVPILLKSGINEQSLTGKQSGLVEIALYGPSEINLANEMEKLRSVKVLRRLVEKKQLNISYFNEGNIKVSNVHNMVPFRLIPVEIKDSSRICRIRFTNASMAGYQVMVGTDGLEKHSWSDVLHIDGNQYRIQLVHAIAPGDDIYITTWVHPLIRVNEILSQMSVYPQGGNSSILMISLKNDNAALGRDILDGLVQEFNIASIEQKNYAAEKTIRFIEDRLDSLNRELKSLEFNNLGDGDKTEVLSVDQQSSLYSQRLSDTEQKMADFDLQLSLVAIVEEYVQKPSTKDKLVPSTLGITDNTVGSMIGAYNSMQQQRDLQSVNLPPGGMMLKQLDEQMAEMRRNILLTLSNYRNSIKKQQTNLEDKNLLYRSKLSVLPDKQRRALEMQRQRSVKENLYLYLLQKKEETAIATASTSESYEQLNAAGGSPLPVEPDAGKIRMFSILLGLLLPIGIIYGRDQLNDRVYTRDDIQKKTKVAIIGEIGHVDDNKSLVVAHQSRNIISEQFRIIRSNLGFFLKDIPFQTLLVTSTVSGEGKSFISINVAAVLALSGKKVALLEFDLRKPRILKNLAIEKTGLGISNYLLGMAHAEEIYTPLDNFPNLHIYPSGIVPPNPAELVMSETNAMFFDYLKANYDYIIIDSAPVGLVSDTFSLAPFIDVSLYIVRHRFTFKRQVAFVEEVHQQRKLPNLFIVVNDLKMGARFGYYGYGYGYGKGYGYGYGYYYGYGGGYHAAGAEEYYDVKVTGWRRSLGKLKRSFSKNRNDNSNKKFDT